MIKHKFLLCSFLSTLVLLEGCGSSSSYVDDAFADKQDDISTQTSECILGEAASFSVEQKNIRVKENLPPDTNMSEIPKEKNIVFFNQKTGKDELIPAKLVETGTDDTTVWKEYVEFNWSFESENRDNEEWDFQTGKKIKLSLDASSPKWEGCASDIVQAMGLMNGYNIDQSSWINQVNKKDDRWVRDARFVLSRQIKGYYAIYEAVSEDVVDSSDTSSHMIKKDAELLKMYKDYNEDTYAFLRIEGSNINHPVMRSPYDEGYYLWHDLNKKYNSHGVPFITLDSNIDASRGNSLIYGHRLNDGDVFSDLSNYSSIEYYREHPIIETITEEGTKRWMIFAYFLVCNSDEESFDYFDNYLFTSKAGYDAYMTEVDKRNMLNVPIEKSVYDSYITLSSCSKEQTGVGNNRMVVMAKKIDDNFDFEECVDKASINTNALLPKKLQK